MRIFNTPLEEVGKLLPLIPTNKKKSVGLESASKLKADDGLSSDTDGGSGDDIDSSATDGKMITSTESGVASEIPSNPIIMEMGDYLKKEVKEVCRRQLLLWIQLMVPRIEDGNNFVLKCRQTYRKRLRGPSIRLQPLQTLAKYFRDRSKIADNWSAHENIEDTKP